MDRSERKDLNNKNLDNKNYGRNKGGFLAALFYLEMFF